MGLTHSDETPGRTERLASPSRRELPGRRPSSFSWIFGSPGSRASQPTLQIWPANLQNHLSQLLMINLSIYTYTHSHVLLVLFLWRMLINIMKYYAARKNPDTHNNMDEFYKCNVWKKEQVPKAYIQCGLII